MVKRSVYGNVYAWNVTVVETDFASVMITNHPDAFITFQRACLELIFDHYSALSILQGTIELNTNKGAPLLPDGAKSFSQVTKLWFLEGSTVRTSKPCV